MSVRGILKAISHGMTAILVILLLCTIFVVISSRAAGGGGPELFGYQFKTVLSGSMEPEIQTGSVIAVKPTQGHGHYNKGDVVTYQAEDGVLITHRIVKVMDDGEHYITKGDHNNASDAKPVPRTNIVGVYDGFTIPYIGYATNFANSSEGSALLLILPGLVLFVYACYTIWQAIGQLEDQKTQHEQ